jgi:phospholipase/lecithinase/hemolysin
VFPEILFINFDFDSLLPVSEENIVKYNMQNTTDRCSRNDYLHNNQPICSNPDQYVFWDYLHPTAIVHSIMAERIFEVLN